MKDILKNQINCYNKKDILANAEGNGGEDDIKKKFTYFWQQNCH